MPDHICHGVLIRVSPGYPPVKGRLHTRYAPVRHSHHPERSNPFDLHVLGLPLAFILSQDQTLHSKVFFDGLNPSLFLAWIQAYYAWLFCRILSYSTSKNFSPDVSGK